MKKFLLFSVVATALTFQLFAQTIPNNGFENWTGGAPDGWMTTNSQLATNVTQETTDFHTGASAAKLVTVNMFVNIAAAIVSGTETTVGTTVTPAGGFPYAVRAKTFSWFYKYTPGTGDSCLIQAWLFKRNGAARDTVAAVTFKSPATVTSYTAASADFVYHTGAIGNETPDSALILICSSHVLALSGPIAGSTLLIDDLSFSGTVATGVKNVVATTGGVSLYPNPATNDVNFKFNVANAGKLNVFDLLGKNVKSFTLSGSDLTFSVNDLNNGLYFYQVLNNRQAVLATGRFSVKK